MNITRTSSKPAPETPEARTRQRTSRPSVPPATPVPKTPSKSHPPTVDIDDALSTLRSMLADSINAAGERLKEDMSARGDSDAEEHVRTFLTSLTPQIAQEIQMILSFTKAHLLPCDDGVAQFSSDPVPNDEQVAANAAKIAPLTRELNAADEALSRLTQLKEKTDAQVAALKDLWETIPHHLSSSVTEVATAVREAQVGLVEGNNMLMKLQPRNYDASSGAALPRDEHDPLMFFQPSSAEVFTAASPDGTIDDSSSRVIKMVLG